MFEPMHAFPDDGDDPRTRVALATTAPEALAYHLHEPAALTEMRKWTRVLSDALAELERQELRLAF